MNNHRKRLLLVFVVCLLGLAVLSCNLEKVVPPTETPQPTPGIATYVFSGSGTNTWIWEDGEYTCDSQVSMELTIDETDNVKLRVRGACLSLSDVGGPGMHESGKCDQGGPDVECSLTIYGYHNRDNGQIAFYSCNNLYLANASGQANLVHAADPASGMQVSGTAECSITGHPEKHQLKFTLP
jgi:hypothetical protein